MLTAKNRDQLRNSALGNRVWASFTFLQVPSTTTLIVNCNFIHYLCHLVFAAILCVKLLEMFITLMSLKHALLVG